MERPSQFVALYNSLEPYCFETVSVLLQGLELGGCWRLSELPAWVEDLSSLRRLDLDDCQWLAAVPDISKLGGLQHLHMPGCIRLTALLVDFGNLSSLQHLSLTYCWALHRLPHSFDNLIGLQHLNLEYSKALVSLSPSFGLLRSLKYLTLRLCAKLESLLIISGS